MNLDTPVEYFYGDTLRWSFGFENPNKAAVIFACMIPLLWLLWQMAWKLGNKWLRISALSLAAASLAGTWYCLVMTYSRGGLLAAAVALGYIVGHTLLKDGNRDTPLHKRPGVWSGVALVAVLAGVTIWSGLGARSIQALGGDASVGNRFELWNGALQMAAENKHGFGIGKSGEQYMQWYQPLESHEGYRTMVNSYLTYLVERGWLWSGAMLLAFVLFWVWTRPLSHEAGPVAIRGSILAFLIAGIFSTTMEDWRLWLLPSACLLVLASISIYRRRGLGKNRLLTSVGVALAGCAALLTIGFLKSSADPLKREFSIAENTGTVTALGPSSPQSRSIGCMIDTTVMGDQYAKLIREMAMGSDVKIYLGNRLGEADRILCSGSGVHHLASYHNKPLLLLAPEKVEDADLSALAARSKPTTVILPEIDEDGRVGFWNEATRGAFAADFKRTDLAGVGNRVDWAWAEVVEMVKTE